MCRGLVPPLRGEEPSRATPGPPAALLGGSQWRRQPRRAISPLDAPPDQAGSGRGRIGHWARTQGRGGAGADKAWGSCRRRLGEPSADFPASVSICAMGRARKPVTETQRSQSMFRAPSRAHLAQLQRGDSEECPARGEQRGPLWRAGMPSAAQGFVDPGGLKCWLCALANTVANREGVYSRQYGGGSSLGAVTSPTSRALPGSGAGAGPPGASSLPTPTRSQRPPGSAGFPPAQPEAEIGRSIHPAPWGGGGGDGRASTSPSPTVLTSSANSPTFYLLQSPQVVVVGTRNPVLLEGSLPGWWGLLTQKSPSGPWS